MNIQFPTLLRPLWGDILWRKNPSEKVIYLTFDDGPVPEVTPLVLDMLDAHAINATFFCVGENVTKHPKLYAEVLRRGHTTGNHTYNHLKGFSVSTKEYLNNIQKAAQVIDSKLFRPPHGQITIRQKNALHTDYRIVMWDIITHDYNQNISPSTIIRTIKAHSRNGSIVVFHDSIKAWQNMLAVLPEAIAFWKAEGYAFGVL